MRSRAGARRARHSRHPGPETGLLRARCRPSSQGGHRDPALGSAKYVSPRYRVGVRSATHQCPGEVCRCSLTPIRASVAWSAQRPSRTVKGFSRPADHGYENGAPPSWQCAVSCRAVLRPRQRAGRTPARGGASHALLPRPVRRGSLGLYWHAHASRHRGWQAGSG